ncbi:MAG: DUF2500 domain-containing protein [Erysipelotrichaceae bacterium]
MFFSGDFTTEEVISQILFIGIFILLVCFLGFQLFSGLKEKISNDRSRILIKSATVIGKRMYVSEFTAYYLTFELNNKERKEFTVSGAEYGMLAESDYGLLTFQGTRFISFERKKDD